MRVRRGVFILLWILSLILISCYGGAISYGFFFGITLIPVISFIYVIYVFIRFRIFQKLESRNMVCGQPMPYYFVLQNNDYCAFSGISVRMHSGFSYVEDMPDDVEYELLPGDKFRHETKLVCKYRGEYDVGVSEIIVTDFFRLIRLHYKVPGNITALVLPKLVRLPSLDSIAEISAFLHKESLTEHTEPDVVVRDYVAGDPIKHIHWKASAKEFKLKTRTLIGEEKQGISILFDTRRYQKDMKHYLPVENKILETLLALGLFFAEKNVPLSVYYGQNRLKRTRVDGIGSFEEFYAETSGVMFDKDENIEDILRQTIEQGAIFNSKLVLCIIHEINAEIMNLTEQLSMRGVTTIIYVVTDDDIQEYIRQSGERKRIIAIPVEAELEGIL